ncbi:sigma-54-dependent transcriptional regulator [Aurantiacibacter rhizosphaerae]|uniref:Response regulator n=1 Tax=Aurantiacibacter rhizosphaerae TaxID=2691582 RepID=A0A844X9L8_9SPHN|nr:sigma-54 dependent transcriptional regulator [Aurantiacibacter rhizosphaerae]MWV27121.1 response regulator [Aurantiacibacter rhizosphaerae]
MTTRADVIFVDDDKDVRDTTIESLSLAGHEVTAFAKAERALERISRDFTGVIVSDIRMPGMDGIQFLEAIQEIDDALPVILVTGHGDVPLAVAAMQKGAFDFLEKPFSNQALRERVARALQFRKLRLENRDLRDTLEGTNDALDRLMVGSSELMQQARERIRMLAATDLDVLLTGETGTGKDLAARMLHDLSPRSGQPFVAINLAVLPEENIEHLLFGHEADAFPGASRARYGKLEHARGGTLYLDEVGSLSPALQTKLLRLVDTRRFERVGSNESIDLDARIITSTNRSLAALTEAGEFRSDLMYRFAVATVEMPPLRDHAEDVAVLFQHLLRTVAARHGVDQYRRPSADYLGTLAQREWPGNVRELRNLAELYFVGIEKPDDSEDSCQPRESLQARMEAAERDAIVDTLIRHRGNLKASYEELGVSRKTLYEKMIRHKLQRVDFTDEAE